MNALKLEIEHPKPEDREPNRPPVNDLRIRLILIPAFGIAIPHLTGYFGPHGPATTTYWVGVAWGIVISFCIWHGNRYFLLRQRQHFDWFRHPMRKITVLAFACVFYTAPLTVLMMLAWYRFAGFGPDWNVIRIVTLACVICVAFITHVYETVYLIQQRESDLVTVERMERARTQAELDALRAQVAPHFLFNSLNALSALIEKKSDRALEFNQTLAEVYRYILVSGKREMVPVEEELEFLRRYVELLKLRFEDGVVFDLADPPERGRHFVPPISLQILVENAVKHNERPLRVTLRFEDASAVVSNGKRPRRDAAPSVGVGLKTLDERCRLVLGRGLEVSNEATAFRVRLPVHTPRSVASSG